MKWIIFLLLLVPSVAFAATADIDWSNPTQYTDNTSIPTVDQARIVTTIYQGSSTSGPWNLVYTSPAGATSAIGVSLTISRGGTYYFTAKSSLDGNSSDYADSISYYYGFLTPNKPINIHINKIK